MLGPPGTILNNLNSNSTFVKWLVVDNAIIAAIDLFASPLQEIHVLNACGVVGNSADDLDGQLQAVRWQDILL